MTRAPDLAQARARRWWLDRRKVGTLRRAAEFIDDVGFAVLFPKRGLALPSLYEVATDIPIEAVMDEWGAETARLWGWKDELPLRGLAWYGHFLRARKSFLSPELLRDLYPRAGRPDDFRDGALGPDARRVAEVILASGPTPTAVLREATGLFGKQGGPAFSRAAEELGRALVVTHLGTSDEGGGWPSAVLELTARAFAVRSKAPASRRRERAARRFVDTMILARPADLARAFGWTVEDARAVLRALADRGEVRRDGTAFSARA